MYVIAKRLIFSTRSIVFSSSRRLLLATVFRRCAPSVGIDPPVNLRSMSQKITSFFSITPNKSKIKKENKDELAPMPETPLSKETTPVNGNTKRVKRSRSSSSENSVKHEESPSSATSVKKKKLQPQCTESSESECDSPAKFSEQTENKVKSEKPKTDESPKNKKSVGKTTKKIKVENESPSTKKKVKRQRIESSESEPDSPAKASAEDEQPEIKLEKSEPPKTYNLPKNQKSKAKTGKKIKVEKKSPSPKTSPKKDVKKSPAVNSYFTIKAAKTEGDSESSGVEKESNRSKEKDNVKKVAEVDYNPAKAKYHPIDDSCWSQGQAIPYLALAKTLEAIEATSARLKMVEILSNYFRSVIALTPEDLLPSIYLCLNQLAPAYHSLELGIAETYLMKAVGQCTGRTLAQMRAATHKCGDLGAAAQAARAAQRTMFAPPPLAARAVLAALRDVAAMAGQASVNKKISKIQSLFVACSPPEARYLIRSLEGKLRIGLAEQSLLQALALACAATPPAGARFGQLDVAREVGADNFKALVEEFALTVKTTYCECPNYELIVPVLLQHGVAALPQHCRLTPGVPLKPMLAHPTRGVHEVFSRFENEVFTCEWKYDGERAQIHVPGDDAPRLADAAIYSRNQENTTSKYPDVLRRLPALLKASVTSCVLDCEAVAYDTATQQILPFQVLATRKRKAAAEQDITVQVCVFVFDLLYLNGRALVREPLEARRALLREHFAQVEGAWQLAAGRDCASEEEVQQLLEESVKGSCEGLMVKALRGERARYDIARRSRNWLKLKKDYLDGVGDTIDAVVIGAYHGRGKRAGLFGGFLLACYDPASEQYQSLCKVGTGFSDEDLRSLSERLRPHALAAPRAYYACAPALAPDAWLGAALVLELRCADLSLSPAHRAAVGLLHPDKGVSLRFPRFVRVRDDKAPEQATSAPQLAQLYAAQDQVKNCSDARRQDLDDFY